MASRRHRLAYVVTNAARVFTYIPRIVVVWRSHDGAQSLSLLTWSSWVIANLTATAYGSLVMHDVFFTLVSLVNLVCCGTVTGIGARRRGLSPRLPRLSSRAPAR
ncbi:MAG: hypothetical protein JWQ73_3290 [Variovorax sp.]|jgi:hypothetical protein|nr:hypothetical protein [Variovorax sp.]